MKKCITAGIVLCGLLSFPALSALNDTASVKAEMVEKDCRLCGHEKGGARQLKVGPFRITDEEYVAWAEKYTPDRVAEWKEVLAERERLKERWNSPEMAAKREAVQKKREDRRKEITILKKQYESGKLTKEEYMKKAYEIVRMGMNYGMKGHALAINLKIAVEENNSRQAALFLNEMLVYFKEHNERIEKKMET
ncbi:hypothetical protein [Bacillus sp. FJAT-27245]|uniref:hypothetical protein n=1 Tax=Bacillus sp. FJAT-27245 TaxID=1684144 RepID=UPI0006A79905|nr:hypothetical protein [Bacillus sp. FJAT-27245]